MTSGRIVALTPLKLHSPAAMPGAHNENRDREVEEIYKTGPSSDWRLQLASMKPESLVMPHQLRHREYVPGLVTPPVTSWKPVAPRSTPQ